MHEFAQQNMSDTITEIDPGIATRHLQIIDDFKCGDHVTAWVEEVAGSVLTDKEIEDALATSEAEGTDIVKMEDYFSAHLEYKATANTGWSLERIKDELEKGRLVIVDYQNWQSEEDRTGKEKDEWGHYSVVLGIKNGTVHLFDPGATDSNGKREIPEEDFVKRWYEIDYPRGGDRSHKILWEKWALSLDVNAAKAWRLAHKTQVV